MKKPAKPAEHEAPTGANGETELWELRLYIAGQTPKSVAAFANLKSRSD